MSAKRYAAVVTGGAGAIGSQLVSRLLGDGIDSIAVVDDLSSGHAWLLPSDARVELIVADVSDLPTLALDVHGGLVFHLAAFFANQNSVDHPLEDLRTNGTGTLATLLWARDARARRVVYASAGCSIAGHDTDGPIHEDMPISLSLDTPYQITKALGEFYCNYFLPEVSTVRCRFFNSYGPGEVPGHYRNVIPNFVWRALHDEPLTITGTGYETRDWIYVDDLVDGLVRAATVPQAHGYAFNLGTGIQTQVLDLAQLVIKACDSNSEIRFAPRRAWDHSLRRQADISRAEGALGFSPTLTIPEGVARTVAWFRDNFEEIERALRETP